MTREQIETIINAKLLANVENINSTVSNLLTALGIIIAIMGVLATMEFFRRKKIVEEVTAEINNDLYRTKQEIINSVSDKANEMIMYEIDRYKKESRKEEYYRNMMYADLSKMLSREIHVNEMNNLEQVFSRFAGRFELITKLTSGDIKETKKALYSLAYGDYEKIRRLKAFRSYIALLKKRSEIAVSKEFRELEVLLESV